MLLSDYLDCLGEERVGRAEYQVVLPGLLLFDVIEHWIEDGEVRAEVAAELDWENE
jgi:hypothetical protein